MILTEILKNKYLLIGIIMFVILGGTGTFFGISSLFEDSEEEKAEKKKKKKIAKESEKIEERAKELINNEQKPSYTDSEYLALSQRMYAAMKGLGTDTDEIWNVLQLMKNEADVVKLSQTFGVQEGETLSEWLESDGYLNESLEILKNRNIYINF